MQKKSTRKKTKKNKASSALVNILLVLILLIGAGLLAYPSFADWWNSMHQSQAIASYVEQVADLSEEENEKMWQAAAAYNKIHNKQGNTFASEIDAESSVSSDSSIESEEPESELSESRTGQDYDSVLDITGTGIMGYINIPKINVNLPIYHGTNETILQIAVGHLEGTSLPIGGRGNHTVLSGHRGLPSAKLLQISISWWKMISSPFRY